MSKISMSPFTKKKYKTLNGLYKKEKMSMAEITKVS